MASIKQEHPEMHLVEYQICIAPENQNNERQADNGYFSEDERKSKRQHEERPGESQKQSSVSGCWPAEKKNTRAKRTESMLTYPIDRLVVSMINRTKPPTARLRVFGKSF